MPSTIEAVRQLQESLDATGVLSPEYRSRIVDFAREAYREGERDALGASSESDPVVTSTEPRTIRALLEDAVVQNERIAIDYIDVLGDESNNRAIVALDFLDRGTSSEALLARDVDTDEYRRFRVDRVQKVVV